MDTKVIEVVKFFDPSSPYWSNNKEYNKRVVEMMLNYCYDTFSKRGYLFLNEVYRELGIPCTRQGQIAGWVFNKDCAKDSMWSIWTKDDGYADVYITFRPLNNILNALSNEEEES